jgi:pimeloyl-ACP methyl ester carboxylesterase
MMECTLEKITVHYKTVGKGRPIVILHGSPGDHFHCMRAFEPTFEARTGWQRIYPDLPGQGKTPGMEWISNEDDIHRIVLDFVAAVVPDKTVTMAGYSYGGYHVQAVVHQRPDLVDGACLLSPATPYLTTEEGQRTLPRHVLFVEDETLYEGLEPDEIEMFKTAAVVQNQAGLFELKDGLRRAFKLADFEFINRIRQNFAFSFDLSAHPEPFDRPSLIVTGRQDAFAGCRGSWEILDNYTRATFAVLDRAGHNIPFEQPRLWRALVDEWLDRVEENTGPK